LGLESSKIKLAIIYENNARRYVSGFKGSGSGIHDLKIKLSKIYSDER
jgi:hypothetical protein